MGYATDLGEVRNGKFFAWGLDDPNHVDRANVFGFMPHAALARRRPRRGAARRGRQRSIAGCLSDTPGPDPITFRSPALFHFAHLPD
jgi:hypothetical protein